MGKLCPGQTKIEEILIELLKEPLNTNDLKAKGYSGSAITTAVRWLKAYKLAETRIIEGVPKIVLNEKGRKIAELVKQIHEILGDP